VDRTASHISPSWYQSAVVVSELVAVYVGNVFVPLYVCVTVSVCWYVCVHVDLSENPTATSVYYVHQGRYIMPGVCLFASLFVCLSVCLLASSRKNY